jgi:hypothetical protein
MHRAVEAIIYQDDRVETRKPAAVDTPRRALATILDDKPREPYRRAQQAG